MHPFQFKQYSKKQPPPPQILFHLQPHQLGWSSAAQTLSVFIQVCSGRGQVRTVCGLCKFQPEVF